MITVKPKKADTGDGSYSIVSDNPMWYRGASAALKAGLLGQWPYLPSWHKAYIIAVVEDDIAIHNSLG